MITITQMHELTRHVIRKNVSSTVDFYRNELIKVDGWNRMQTYNNSSDDQHDTSNAMTNGHTALNLCEFISCAEYYDIQINDQIDDGNQITARSQFKETTKFF